MKILNKLSCFFDRINREIRMLNIKTAIIFAAVFLFLGIFSWMIGGRIDRVTFFFMFPRCAMKTVFMFIIWSVSFAFCGAIFAGILFGCEKYRRSQTYKCALFVGIMQVFTYAAYPLFFGATAPFVAFLAFLIAEIFCFLGIASCAKIYSLWTICLSIHLLWLIYNGYVALAFAFIN